MEQNNYDRLDKFYQNNPTWTRDYAQEEMAQQSTTAMTSTSLTQWCQRMEQKMDTLIKTTEKNGKKLDYLSHQLENNPKKSVFGESSGAEGGFAHKCQKCEQRPAIGLSENCPLKCLLCGACKNEARGSKGETRCARCLTHTRFHTFKW